MSFSDEINIIGHRGFPELYPENTAIAVSKAIELGVHGIEIDIQLTQDGQCVLLHDETLDRTTCCSGRADQLSLESITQISAHEPDRFGEAYIGETIPSLEIISQLCYSHRCQLFIELKLSDTSIVDREFYVEQAIKSSVSAGRQRRIISYDKTLLEIARKKCQLPIGWVLTQYDSMHERLAKKLNPDFLICNYTKLPKNKSKLWSGAWKWFIYDVKDIELMSKLRNRGVTYFESWNPKALLK